MAARPEGGRIFFVVALALAIVTMAPARGEARTYDASNVARLSQVVDEAYVLGKGDVDWSYADPNLTLEKGDLLRTDETGMAEIQFDANLLLRIGEDTHAALVEMGKEKVVGVDSGSVYLRVARTLPSAEGFFLTFPGGQLFAIGPALVRLDVYEDGGARLSVVRGEIGLVTKAEEAKSIPAGVDVSIDPEGKTQPVEVEAFPLDDFDRWNEQRDIAFSTADRPKQVAAGVVGVEDLDDYGAWVRSDTFNTDVWRPYVVDGWKPYYNGRWVYSSETDWTWVPVEPWGYATHHYGSWNYDPDYGWVWIPGSTWHAANVNWVVYDDYVGWVPVGYYGYPVISEYPYYVTDYYAGYVDYVTFSFVAFSSFGHHHGHHHGHHDRHGHRGHHDGDDGHRGGKHDGGGHDGGGHDGGRDGGGHDGVRNKTLAEKFDTYKDRRTGKKWLDVWNDAGRGGGGVDDDGVRTIPEKRDTFRKRMTGRQWLDSWNERKSGKAGAEGLRLTVDGEKLDTARLKNAKLRFIKNSGDLGVEKSLRKGSDTRLKADHGKIVDIARHPELRKKVARLESDPRRREKINAAAAKAGLPKKAVRDNAKRFDFRGADKMSGKARIEKARSVRAVARASEGRIRETASQRAGGDASQYSRARDEFKRRQAVERVKKNRDASRQGRSSVSSTPSVRKIEITDKDLRGGARKFRREDSARSKTRDRWARQTTERISPAQSAAVRDSIGSFRSRRSEAVKNETSRPGRSALGSRSTESIKKGSGRLQSPNVRDSIDSIRNRRSEAVKSETSRPGRSALGSRSTESMKNRFRESGRLTEPGRSSERHGSSVKTRERSARTSRVPGSAIRSPSASNYSTHRSGMSGRQGVLRSGESTKSRGFGGSDRSGYTRNSQSRMGYRSGSSTGRSQSYAGSSQPSRGGGRSVSGIRSGRSGRSGGGSVARGRPARAAARARAARR